ncbi:MAG: ABC transporter permease [Chitinivibrionales bacterium]|nr:ABC transporter permease [Chitinivibrionales bacterium]
MILLLTVLSFVIIFLVKSYLEGMYWGLRLGYTRLNGNMQVASKGYWDETNEEKPLLSREMTDSIITRLKTIPEIRNVHKEITFQGLIGTEYRSTVISGTGIEVDATGGSAVMGSINIGRKIFDTDKDAIVIGEGAAKKIGVNIDDWVIVFSQTVGGALNPMNFQIKGIATTGIKEADNFYAVASIDSIQALRDTQAVERLLVFFNTENNFESNVKKVENILTGLPVESKIWTELSPLYFDLKSFYDGIFVFMMFVIIVLVCISIFELLSMSIFERFREIGTLRAIGNTKSEIFTILLLEVLILYSVSIVVGMGLGWIIGVTANNMHITWKPPGSSSSVPFSFFLQVEYYTLPILVVFFSILSAAVVPVIRATRLKVIEVLRYE